MRRIVWSHEFEDTGAMLAFIRHTGVCEAANRQGELKSTIINASRTEWTQTRDLPEAMNLAAVGWAAGAHRIANMTADMPAARARGRAASYRYDVAGELPDVARYMSGAPDYMRRKVNSGGNKRQKIVTVAVNPSMSGNVDAERRVNQGAAIVALVDSLESAGYRVQVVLDRVQTAETSGLVRMACELKAASEPVDVERLAFWIAHPSALRRVFFAAAERLPGYWKNAQMPKMNGSPDNYKSADEMHAVYGAQSIIYFPSLSGRFAGLGNEDRYQTPASAGQTTAEIIERFNSGEDCIF